MNIEADVAESFADLAHWSTRTGQDLQKQIDAHGAVISIRQAGGPVDDYAGDYRLIVEVYAAKYPKMWEIAEAVSERLFRGHFRAGRVYIDSTDCISAFAERPLSETTRVLNSTWTLTARHHLRRPIEPVAP